MCFDDEENNVKRILGSEPAASRPLSDMLPKKDSGKEENTAEQNNQADAETISQQNGNSENGAEQISEASAPENSKFTPPAKLSAQNDPEENRMPLLSHLGELRTRLTRIVIMVLIGFFGFYGISEMAYTYLAEPLTRFLPEGSTLIYTSPQGAFFTYMKVALMLSILGTSPFSFYQIWAFIAPGLYKEEQRAVLPLAFFSAFFFLAGAAFCYFAVFPVAFKFFMGFTSDLVKPMISVEEYLSFALKLVIAFGLVFEMPLFAFFLARLRLLTADAMRRYRKYAVLIIFIMAAILTPPDVFSQTMMAVPMLLLYEVSIYIAKAANNPKPNKKKTADQNSGAEEEKAGHANSEETKEQTADHAETANTSDVGNSVAGRPEIGKPQPPETEENSDRKQA